VGVKLGLRSGRFRLPWVGPAVKESEPRIHLPAVIEGLASREQSARDARLGAAKVYRSAAELGWGRA